MKDKELKLGRLKPHTHWVEQGKVISRGEGSGEGEDATVLSETL